MTNKPLRIFILSPAHPLRGGIAALSERLARALQAQGAEVRIISFSLQYPAWLFPGKTQYTTDPAPSDLHIQTLVNSIHPLNWLRIGRLIRRERPDLLLIRYWLPFMAPCLGTITRIARRNGHTRVLAIADNILPHERRPGDRLLTRYFVKSVEAFVVMSRSVAQDLRRFTLQKPVIFTPHPVYDNYGDPVDKATARATLHLKSDEHYVLFFGFIRRYKGLDLLIEAMADERLRALKVQLIVAGEFYEAPEPYHALLARYNLSSEVILHTHFIPNEQVKYYFGAADIVVQPYRSATQSGISQLAFHFAKPMIVTDVGGLPETVQHGQEGYVVPVQPQAIADAMVDFFAHQRSAALEAGVQAGKKRYSWHYMSTSIENLYKQLTDG